MLPAMAARIIWLCLSAQPVALGSGGLVGPGAVGSYQGGSYGRRHGGYVRVQDPSVGFFVGGSSIKEMNGLYGRVHPEKQRHLTPDRTWQLAYKHDFTGWYLCLASIPAGVSSPSHRDTEWLFLDNDGVQRFAAEGGSLIPAAGENFQHLHRHIKDEPDMTAGQRVSSTVMEDDKDELPWQLIGVGGEEMLQKLRNYFRYYKHTVQQAIMGKDLPALPHARNPDEAQTMPPEDAASNDLLAEENPQTICSKEKSADVEKAIEVCRQKKDTWQEVAIHLALGRCYRHAKHYENAIFALRAARQLKPRYPEVYLEEGLREMDLGNYASAVLKFETMLKIQRDHPQVLGWLQRASVMRRREEEEQTRRDLFVRLEDRETESCIAWRQTGACNPAGAREPTQDASCSESIAAGRSGYCECRGFQAKKTTCSEKMPFRCMDVCRASWPADKPVPEKPAPPPKPPCESSNPPSWCSVNHYLVLGARIDIPGPVDHGSDNDELKRIYKKRSLQVHPDKAGGHVQAFQKVAEAFEVLTDAEKKAEFDFGDDLERGRNQDNTQKPPYKEEIARKYFPENFGFEPFGDPQADRKERQHREQKRLEQQRQRELERQLQRARELENTQAERQKVGDATKAAMEQLQNGLERQIHRRESRWITISASAACDENDQGISRIFGESPLSLEACKAKCIDNCQAIDYFTETSWCSHYESPCHTPLATTNGASSYRKVITLVTVTGLEGTEASANGIYRITGMRNGKFKYKQDGGSGLIFHQDGWKMSIRGDLTADFTAAAGVDRAPPAHSWSVDASGVGPTLLYDTVDADSDTQSGRRQEL